MTPAAVDALPFIKQGWKIFPAHWVPKVKDGLKGNHMGYVKWGEGSSSDPEKLAEWSSKFPDAYYCVNLKASGLVVIDVDVKSGKDGRATLKAINNGHGPLPETMQSATPNGGDHLIFTGDCRRRGANALGDGVDVVHMIPLPGQHAPGKGLYKLVKSGSPVPLPKWIIEFAGQDRERTNDDRTPVCDLDLDHNVNLAVKYLIKAPAAVENDGGDKCAVTVARLGYDFAISESKTIELMSEHWNPRCQPPWPPDELARKVHNGYKYAKDRPGNATPDALFPTEKENSEDEDEFYTSYQEIKSKSLKVNWVIPGYIEEDTVSLWFSDWGNFKSFLSIHLSMTKAAGMTWVSKKLTPGPVLLIQGEGQGGTKRRIEAFSKKYNIPADAPLPFFSSRRSAPINDHGIIEFVVSKARKIQENHGRLELIVIDTLAANFGEGSENSTDDMKTFVNKCNEIRRQVGCAIIIVHHTGLGDKGRARGSVALSAGVDTVFKISREDMHVCLHQPHKMKDGEPPKDTWFKGEIIPIGMDEDGGVITSLAFGHDPLYQPEDKAKPLGQTQQFLVDNIPQEGIKADDLHDLFKTWKGESYHRQNFYRALNALKSSKMCHHSDNLLFCIFS